MVRSVSQPLVSVIVPVYRSRFLERTLCDLRRQTWQDLEIIVVDNGNTPEYSAWVRQLCAHDDRICYLQAPTPGAGPARNLGMDAASGQYLLFLDADDSFSPRLVAELTTAAQRTCADVAVCGFEILEHRTGARRRGDPQRLPPGTYGREELATQVMQCFSGFVWNKLFRAASVREVGARFKDLPYSNDMFFVYRMLYAASRVTVLESALLRYRVGAGGSIQDRKRPDARPELEACDALWTAVSAGLDDAGRRALFDGLIVRVRWCIGSCAATGPSAGAQAARLALGAFVPRWQAEAGTTPSPALLLLQHAGPQHLPRTWHVARSVRVVLARSQGLRAWRQALCKAVGTRR